MSPRERASRAVLGFRVKSGWACAVLIAGTRRVPQVIDRRVVELSDPAVPESKQPYHAGFGTLEESRAEIRRRTAVVERVATRSITALLDEYHTMGSVVRGAGLVVGSRTDPTSIRQPHMRAHALEGQLFWRVLEDALAVRGLSCSVFVEREIYAKAAVVLGRSPGELKRLVADLGRALGGRWRVEEKSAALAAWMRLA